MRNLKRVLSLALALVMVLGMMVITTSAATFTDAEEITQTEAVEVLAALGIVEGSNGAFNPKGTFTREAAAKLLTYMKLGPAMAEKLAGTDVFTDVAADRWSAKYIGYCANLGYITGVGDGKFNPDGVLKDIELGKLVLCALGKDPAKYTGANWASAVTVDMIETGLVDTVTGTAISREDACAMILAGLKYSETPNTYEVRYTNDSKATYNKVGEFDSLLDAELYATILGAYSAGTGYYTAQAPATDTLMAKVYKVSATRGVDAYGRPANTYTKAPTLNLAFADEPYAKYEGTFNKAAADALTEANISVPANAIYNGYGSVALNTLYAGAVAAKGVTIELYNTDDDKDIETVIAIESNYAVVKDVTLTEGKTAGSVTITVSYYDGNNQAAVADKTYTDNLNSKNDAYDTLCGYAKDTALVVTLGNNWSLMKVEEPTAVTGKITKLNIGTYNSNSTVTVGETTYAMNNLFTTGKTLVAGAEGTLYLDAAGNAIGWTNKQAPKAQYAFVLDYAPQSDIWGNTTHFAKLLYTDGTTETVEVTAAATKDVVVTYADGTGPNTGKIVLSAVSGNKTAVATSGAMTITQNTATLGSAVANDKTTFVVQTTVNNKPVYTVYTGVTNVPGMSFNKMGAVKGNGIWDVYFALGATLDTTPNTAKNVVYLTADSTLVKEVVSATKTLYYYVCDAIVNGEITTVKVAADTQNGNTIKVGTGLYDALTYDDDGLVIAGTAKQANQTTKVAMVSETGTAVAKDGIIVLGQTSYIYNDSTVVYKVANGGISLSSIGALKADQTDTVVGFTTNGILTMVVVTVVNP